MRLNRRYFGAHLIIHTRLIFLCILISRILKVFVNEVALPMRIGRNNIISGLDMHEIEFGAHLIIHTRLIFLCILILADFESIC
ncbi:hypothetical protein RCL_jg13937.t1 [Rhizophagus clarus]|uniref:Uncharacterized protein n=1 Tax=Rhizophagus clarus TaxID=94130 RepID=A0A8H3LSJ0_9GLOM|nr:hypothetical protein RCL_jg13937.t1 [Rhizophagus clarus]